MRFLIQRVERANVKVGDNIVGNINNGLLVLIGITNKDTKEIADYLVNKLIKLRIFEDENEKMNLSIQDIKGELLLISQFTLYANCKDGNRPSFTEAAKPDFANELYEYIIQKCEEKISKVETGIFGANMMVSLKNDGPVTIMIEK